LKRKNGFTIGALMDGISVIADNITAKVYEFEEIAKIKGE